jgi:serine/threonine protein kinase
METRPDIHPSADTLRAFALKQLDDGPTEALRNHLASCPICSQEVAAMTTEDRNATPIPMPSLYDNPFRTNAAEPVSMPPVDGLPPELARHPQYEIVRELGRGGMGVVYLARNKLMARLEVLKVVNKDLLERSGVAERFHREIQSAALLNHANVVKAYSALQLGGSLALAMEYVEGEDLAKVVKERGPLPVGYACYYAREASLGLQHAFEKHMVHRDIKPQNLILARDGPRHIVKVLDFGLAKVLREGSDYRHLTGTGMMLGTPHYMAPEQTLDAAYADIRADIYSLGCTLYFFLTGSPPFKGKNVYDILQAQQTAEPSALNRVRPDVPEELAKVACRMLAKEPAQRYQTPLEAAKALAPFIKQERQATAPVGKPEPPAPLAILVDAPPPPAASPPLAAKLWSPPPGISLFVKLRTAQEARNRPLWFANLSAKQQEWLLGAVAAGLALLALLGLFGLVCLAASR